jgi:hypothetical protein
MSRLRKIVLGIVAIIILAFIALQLVPPEKVFPDYKYTGNPPVDVQFKWDSPQTEALARAACYDCHSNETRYPWYSRIAPMSWIINRDVNVARDNMNFSTWNKRDFDVDDMIDQIQEEAMPLPIYLPLHAEAQLTAVQKQQLIAGLQATFTN